MTEMRTNLKYIFPFILIIFLLFSTSCDMGKWQAEGKYIFFDDGSADVTFRLYPIDRNAKMSFDRVEKQIKEEQREAKVVVIKKKKEKYIIVRKRISAKKNFYLKKKKGKWQFHHLNQFPGNVEIRKMQVVMPGWITNTNATYHFANQAYWDNLHVGNIYEATSTTLPCIYVVGLVILGIVLLLGGTSVLYLLRREKKEEEAEKQETGQEEENETFQY